MESSDKRVLHLNLKGKWFDLIASGEKTEELRRATVRWKRRLAGRDYDEIHLKRGYPAKADYATKRLIRKWTGVTKRTIVHEEFGGDPVEVYVIDVSQEVS